MRPSESDDLGEKLRAQLQLSFGSSPIQVGHSALCPTRSRTRLILGTQGLPALNSNFGVVNLPVSQTFRVVDGLRDGAPHLAVDAPTTKRTLPKGIVARIGHNYVFWTTQGTCLSNTTMMSFDMGVAPFANVSLVRRLANKGAIWAFPHQLAIGGLHLLGASLPVLISIGNWSLHKLIKSNQSSNTRSTTKDTGCRAFAYNSSKRRLVFGWPSLFCTGVQTVQGPDNSVWTCAKSNF